MTEYVEIVVEEVKEKSGMSIVVMYEGKEQRLPRSQLKDFYGHPGDKDLTIEVAQWLLEERGMV